MQKIVPQFLFTLTAFLGAIVATYLLISVGKDGPGFITPALAWWVGTFLIYRKLGREEKILHKYLFGIGGLIIVAFVSLLLFSLEIMLGNPGLFYIHS